MCWSMVTFKGKNTESKAGTTAKVYLWPRGRLILLAEILRCNKSALCRSASTVFSFVLFYTLTNAVWLQHVFY